MLDPQTFHDIASGKRRGFGAGLVRCALRLAAQGYTWGVGTRNRCYDWRLSRVHRVAVPVVSVGNLTLGGTGKTPLVAWLVRWFDRRGVRAAIVSRGYGAHADSPNDEAMELAEKLPGVPHVQDPDRVTAARMAIETTGCRLILLDDAFQHRRIARDLDLVLLDACEPFGYGAVFPRGTLREPVESLRRADVVVLSRADMLAQAGRERVWNRVRQAAPKVVCAEAAHVPAGLRSASGVAMPLDALSGKPMAAFCAIGNPAGFRHTLVQSGVRPAGWRVFPDHHRYTADDLQSLAAWAEQLHAAAVVCTHKDLVKIGLERLGARPLWAVCVEFQFLAGQEDVERCLEQVAIPHERNPQ